MGRTKNFSEEIEKQIIHNYIVLKQGLQTAGKDFGASQYMVEKILKKYNIPKRTYTEAKQLGRKYPCDDDFFKNQNEDMAYILGFIAADGYISTKENCISIEIQEQDKQILEQIATITKVSRPIQSQLRKSANKITYTLRNWSREWKQDLEKYGITPRKTFSLKPPKFLSSKYYKDYIRGYFDGDGCIYFCQAKNGKGTFYIKNTFQIDGASKEQMEWIYQELINYGIILNQFKHETCSSGTIMYKVQTNNKKELQKIYDLFYKDNKSKLYLPRKKEKFETILNIPRDSDSLVRE